MVICNTRKTQAGAVPVQPAGVGAQNAGLRGPSPQLSSHAAGRGPEAGRGDGRLSPPRTHPGGPARGPARRWCTAPPAQSAPPSASPSCCLPCPVLGPPPASRDTELPACPTPAARQHQSHVACARSSSSRPKQSKTTPPSSFSRELVARVEVVSGFGCFPGDVSGLESGGPVIPDICVHKLSKMGKYPRGTLSCISAP